MYELVIKYQKRMGWDDQTTIKVLCEFVEDLDSDFLTSLNQIFKEYLKKRT